MEIMKCQNHNKDYQMLCTTCHMTPVCSDCIDDEHSEHSFASSKKVVKEEKTRLSQLKTENDNVISQLSYKKKKTEEQIKRRKEISDNNEGEINVQRKHLHDLVDEVADDMIELYKSASKIDMDSLEVQIKSLSASLTIAEKYRTSVEVLLEDCDDFTVIQRAKEVQVIPQFIEISTVNVDTKTCKRRNVTKTMVRHMFECSGDEEETSDDEDFRYPKGAQFPVLAHTGIPSSPDSMTEVASFQHGDTCVTLIRKSKQLCIFKEKRQNVLKWVDKKGHTESIKNFNTYINGFTSTLDNRLLVCCYDKMEILEATLCSVRPVVSTSPLKPIDIGITKTGDYIVIVEDAKTYNITSKSIRCIIVYNKDWTEKTRVIEDEYGHNICESPHKIAISNSGTIAIVNYTSAYRNHLVILEHDLRLKFRIIAQGQVLSGNNVLPDLTTCDKYCILDVAFVNNDHVIVSDFHSRSIQLLDEQGKVIRVLFTFDTYVWSLCLDNEGQLWTGNEKGRVAVYKV